MRTSRVLSCFLLSAALSACAATLSEPSIEAPHAELEVRVIYQQGQGLLLAQDLTLNERKVALPQPVQVPAAPLAAAFRVDPGPARFGFQATLSHAETARKRVTVRVENACAPPLGCGQTHTEERDQWVTELVQDSTCQANLEGQLEVGKGYVLQVEFRGHGDCRLQMVRSQESVASE